MVHKTQKQNTHNNMERSSIHMVHNHDNSHILLNIKTRYISRKTKYTLF